jgi:hypothetical protein
MKSIFHILATSLAMAVAMTPAAASVKVATYKGIISDGTDVTGVFGNVGQDLTGLSYITAYTYDRNRGALRSTDGATYDGSFSRTIFDSPVISATITVNGVMRRIGGSLDGSAYTNQAIGFVQHTVYDLVYRDGFGAESEITNFGRGVGVAESLEENVNSVPVNWDGYPAGMTISYFTFDNVLAFASAHFSADAVYSVSESSGVVPEPASWTMLIAGFGLIGAAARRRRTAAAIA